jgi:hypothetical protein
MKEKLMLAWTVWGKRYAISTLHTFLAVFFTTLGVSIGELSPEYLTMATIASAAIAAFRSAIKAISEKLFPRP